MVEEVGHALRSPLVRAIDAKGSGDSLDEVLDEAALWHALTVVDYVIEFVRSVLDGLMLDVENVMIPLHIALERVKGVYPQIVFGENLQSAWGSMDGRLIARVTEVLLKQFVETYFVPGMSSGETPPVFLSVLLDTQRNEVIVSIGEEQAGSCRDQVVDFPSVLLRGKLSAALLFCNQVVEMHKGRQVWASQSHNSEVGVNFHFSLPIVSSILS